MAPLTEQTERNERSEGGRRPYGAACLVAFVVVASIARLGPSFSALLGRDDGNVVAQRRLGAVDDPGLAWLMTFPSSGTTYTTSLVAMATRYATANNIGNTVAKSRGVDNFLFVRGGSIDSRPVSPAHPNGPFKFEHDIALPPPGSFMLTKTHCSGFCFECPPPEYRFNKLEFFNSCRMALQFKGQKETPHWYDETRVKKVVHLIRNPFDNVVSRFHHYYKLQHRIKENRGGKGEQNFITSVPYSGEGFLQWCRHTDEEFLEHHRRNFDAETFELLSKVPCHAEFLKYVHWHNMAFVIVSDPAINHGRELPTMVLKYEDYAYDFSATFGKLLAFLKLPHRGTIKEFSYNTYVGYFSNQNKRDVEALLRKTASAETWKHLEDYFSTPDDDVVATLT